MPRFTIFLALASLLFITACDAPAPVETDAVSEPAGKAAAEPAAEQVKAEIDWFDGSVEEAFALAEADNRPLFLYWGAVWCPPCVEIRSTVFRSQRFIAMSRLFIPVYLDGDTDRAQEWGDRFDTKVYPTMIVFNPQGEEVTRLNAGIDISAYNDVLEASLERMQPIRELVSNAMDDPGSLGEADFQQLAYYSWYDDKALPEETPPGVFLKLSDAAKDRSPSAAARLYLQYATLAGDEGEMADPARVEAILSAPDLLFASWDYLITPEQILPGLEGDEGQIGELRALWAGTMREQRADPRLTVKNQLYGWRPWLVFHFEGDEDRTRPLPDDVAEAIRADGKAATDSVAGTSARQSVINTLSNVYILAGMTEDARALLKQEIGQSKTPYYFMGSLASLEEGQGNTPAALDWWSKAYQTAEGPATRIRWWTRYVEALTRLSPEEQEKIVEVAMYPFEPSQGMDALFSGANFRNLDRAARGLYRWDANHHAGKTALGPFLAQIEALCAGFEKESSEHDRCSYLLNTEI